MKDKEFAGFWLLQGTLLVDPIITIVLLAISSSLFIFIEKFKIKLKGSED
jgi:hypothetical protein